MKKTKILATVLSLIVLLVACKKELINVSNTTDTKVHSEPFRFEQNSVFSRLNNLHDKADHHINACLYHAGDAIKNTLLSDPAKATTLFQRYESGENAIKIKELVTEESINFIDQKHYNTFSAMEQSMVYQNVNYYNVLSLMNNGDPKTVLSNSDKFIIAIAVEINDEDAIPGWVIENGNAKETTILEKDLNSNTPIFIVQNATDHIEYSNNDDPTTLQWTGTPSNNARTTGPITIDWDSYRIKSGHRYENTGRSELEYLVTFYDPIPPHLDGDWLLTLQNNYGLLSYQLGRTIKSVRKQDIDNSTLLTDNKWFIQNHPANLYDVADAQYYITVYERDWAQSPKTVQSCQTLTHNNIRMKYSNEWYYVDYCGFSAKNSFVGASFTVDNSKCTLTLTRTN